MSKEHMNDEKIEEWNKEFDEDYQGDDWVVGIIASALVHARLYEVGEDASYITNKLRKKLEQIRKDERRKVEEEVGCKRMVKIGENQLAMSELKMSMQEIKDHNNYADGYNKRSEEVAEALTTKEDTNTESV